MNNSYLIAGLTRGLSIWMEPRSANWRDMPHHKDEPVGGVGRPVGKDEPAATLSASRWLRVGSPPPIRARWSAGG